MMPTMIMNAQHGISITLYNDNLIISNRGAERLDFGTLIFRIRNKAKITEDFIKELRAANGTEAIIDCLMKNNIDVLDTKGFDLKEQRHGTCTFVNEKSAIIAYLYLLRREEGASQKEATQYAEKYYKIFTNEIRNIFIEKLLDKFGTAKDEKERDFYITVMADIIQAHHGQDKPFSYPRMHKKTQEVDRAAMIFEGITPEYRQKLLTQLQQKMGVNADKELNTLLKQFKNEYLSESLLKQIEKARIEKPKEITTTTAERPTKKPT